MADIEDRYTAAELSSLNPFVPNGQLWMERDTGKVKRGKGSQWADLDYWPPAATLTRDAATSSVLGDTVEDAINNTRYGRVSANVTNATTSYADVTGLTWSVVASGVYIVEATLFLLAEATTVGVRLALNGPTIGAGAIQYGIIHPTTTTAVLFESGAAFDAAQTVTATPSATVPAIAYLSGSVALGATAGTLAVRVASEDTNDAIIAAGSWGRVTRIA